MYVASDAIAVEFSSDSLKPMQDREPSGQAADVGLVVMAAAFSVIAQWRSWDDHALYAFANTLATVAVVGMGVLTRNRSWSLIAMGLLWAGQWLTTWNAGPLPLLGSWLCTVFFLVAANELMSHPKGLGKGTPEKAFLAYYLSTCFVIQVAITFATRPEWYGLSPSVWWPTLIEGRWLIDFTPIWAVCSGVFFITVLGLRVRRMTRLERAFTAPFILGACGVCALSAITDALTRTPGTSGAEPSQFFPTMQSGPYALLAVALTVMPVGLLMSRVRGRLRHFVVAENLHRQLTRTVGSVDAVRLALREALDDPALDILYWVPGAATYVDGKGSAVDVPDSSDTKLVRPVTTASGEPLAILIADESLERYPQLIDAVVSSSSIALHNAQLQADSRSQLDEVQRSRVRVAEAAQAERQRIERDLHDGVQQRLLAIGARLGVLRGASEDATISEGIDRACGELKSTLSELRDLARGISPPELRQFGLSSAISVVAEGLPISTTVSVVDERFSPIVEATAYFVICESLVNVTRHSRATTAVVEAVVKEGALVVKVTDDGSCTEEVRPGQGLTNLKDRVQTIGGELEITPRPGTGLTIKATIPCR